MSNKNEVFEYLIDQLRQQVNNSRSEDLAHEVQSLKNQLRDASAQIKELQKELDTTNNTVVRLRKEIAKSTGNAQEYIDVTEQSGCRKEDTQECDHNWIIAPGLFIAESHKGNVPGSRFCCECGAREWDDAEYKPKNDTQECEHDWYFYDKGASMMCKKCGLKK